MKLPSCGWDLEEWKSNVQIMLYLISGASRAGKTIIGQKVSLAKGISCFSLDWIVMGFTNGMAEYGIHDKLFPDEIAEKSWSFLEAMFESMLYDDINYIVEGEALLPELLSDLLKKYPDKIRPCFVGYTEINVEEKVSSIKRFSAAKGDWLKDKSNEYITDHVKNMIAHSRKIKSSCDEYDMKYIDTSKDFLAAQDDAIKYLLAAR